MQLVEGVSGRERPAAADGATPTEETGGGEEESALTPVDGHPPRRYVAAVAKETLSHPEACVALGVSDRTLSRLRRAGKITPCPTIGGRVAYLASDVKRLAQERERTDA
jgi:hypothetical protein